MIIVGCIRRGRCPHRPVVQTDDHMNMIRHDHICFDFGDIPDVFFHDPPIRLWDDVGIVPYDVAQDFAPVLGADCDKICAVLAVIIMADAIWLPLADLHSIPP